MPMPCDRQRQQQEQRGKSREPRRFRETQHGEKESEKNRIEKYYANKITEECARECNTKNRRSQKEGSSMCEERDEKEARGGE